MRVISSCLRLIKTQGRLIAGVGAGLVVGIGSAVAFAAIPDQQGVIHACYQTTGNVLNPKGSIRVIDTEASETCTASETAITWNQTGPQGPAGPEGPQGPAGPNGFVSNMINANFTGASLQYRDFSGLDLHGANFVGANVVGGSFSEANLAGSSFGGSGSKYTAATFYGANLTGANLNSPTSDPFADATFQNANLTDGTIFSFNTSDPNAFYYNNVDFRGANLTNTYVYAHFKNANFSGVDFSPSNIVQDDGITFTAFKNSNLSDSNFSNLTLDSVRFFNSNLSNANFTNTQFDSVSFLGSDLSSAVIIGNTWNNTVCPDGTNSNDNGSTCVGHLVP